MDMSNNNYVREGYIFDFATKKPVDFRKPEEKVRQEYEKILYDDYDYSLDQMDIEVSIQRGEKHSAKNKNEKADIVIYKTTNKNRRNQNEDILGIVETKRPTRKEGIKQLMSYMSATSCIWGVWTNGTEIEYVYRNPINGEVKENFVYQIPKNGESFEDIGKIAKDKLKPASNLKLIFRRLLNTLYSNTNISRREKLGNEMIRIIFCKIWDERYDVTSLPKFKVGFEEKPKEVSKRIQTLFIEVKAELVSDGVFDKNEEIKLDDKSIAYVVGELEQFSLLKTDKDIVGDAFEVFAESKLVGEKGEFFTPREIVKIAIKIIDPQPEQSIVDPACGSGGFLIYALEHIWKVMDESKKYRGIENLIGIKKDIAQKYIYGIDKEIDLVKIAKAYMAIIGDGRSGIVQQNSLHTAEDFEGRAKELFVENDEFKTFDIIMTNPPFGSKTKVLKDDAQYFELGYKWVERDGTYIKTDESRDTAIQELFIERCLEMLKEGGKLAIVLPETYFHAPSTKYILAYLKKDNNIKAVIDLPHNTFRPYCNAKTVLLILEKGKPQQNKIIMAVAEEMGHDHRGNLIYRYDESHQKFTTELWDDTAIIRKELDNLYNPKNQYVFVVNIKDIKENIYVPRYYWDKKIKGLQEEANKLNLKFVSVKELMEKGIIKIFRGHGAPPSEFKGKGEVPYVRAGDIVSWEMYKNPVAMVPYEVYKAVKGNNGVDLQSKDIVFVKEGSYRIGSVALISPLDTGILLNHHSLVFRVINSENEYGIDAFYLLYLFSHKLTQKQLYNKIMIDTTLPNIGNRWKELYLPVAINPKEREKISQQIEEAFKKKWEAQQQIVSLQEQFGTLTT